MESTPTASTTVTTATTFARRCCSSTSTCNRPCHSDNMCSNHIRLRRCSCLFDVDNDTSASTFLTSFDGAPRIARVGGFSAAVVFGLVVVLFCTVPALALSDWPPAPNSGGASCNINAEPPFTNTFSGYSVAYQLQIARHCDLNAVLLQAHARTQRLTDMALFDSCVCAANMYGCRNCHAKAVLVRDPKATSSFEYSTEFPMLDGSGRYINLCSVPHGGRKCSSDAQCGGMGGLCISGHCVCPDGYLCGNCAVLVNDFLYGLNCTFSSGGGKCSSNEDCHNGSCLRSVPGEPATCQCNPLFACPHCTAGVMDLVNGRVSC
eukprot:gene543-3861_t